MKKSRYLPALFYATFFAAVLVLMISTLFSTVQDVALNSEQLSDFNSGWNIAINGKSLGIINLPATVAAKKGNLLEPPTQYPKT